MKRYIRGGMKPQCGEELPRLRIRYLAKKRALKRTRTRAEVKGLKTD